MRVLSLVEGSIKETPSSNSFCIASFAASYAEASTNQEADLNISLLIATEGNVLIEGKDIDSNPIEAVITATEEDIKEFSDSGGINPQKVIAYLFRVASDLLAPDPKNPN